MASLLFVCGLICVKRATTHGITSWTVTFLANQWAAIVFSTLWFLGGPGQPWAQLWQPAVIAMLYVCGQVATFSAIRFGDVSLATPIFGIKVVLVSFLVTFSLGQNLTALVWGGAILATIGIGLVQWVPPRKRTSDARPVSSVMDKRGILLTVGLAVSASVCFALFDILVQSWAPAWGAGRLLPISYWFVAVFSLVFWPWFQRPRTWNPHDKSVLLAGTLLIALQALCIVFTLSTFGDAARVNVVYALRALWGVVLAWAVAKRWGGSEATLPSAILLTRFVGAGLLTFAVILVIVAST